MACSMKNLHPSFTVLSQESPHELSGDINLPKQIWSSLSNWFNEDTGDDFVWQG